MLKNEDAVYHLQYTAAQIAAATGKSPIIQLSEDGRQTWWIWDITAMAYKDTGVVAYLGDINEAKTSADRAEASATAAREAAKEAADSATGAVGYGGGSGDVGELEDTTLEVGSLINAGAGWNTYRFREAFDAPPQVVLQAQDFTGTVQIKNITAKGFLYCLRTESATTEDEVVVDYIAIEYGGDR